MDDSNQIEKRKNDHIQINLDYDVSSKGITSGLDTIPLSITMHCQI